MRDLVFKKAGNLKLFRYRDSKTFLFNGTINSLTPSITTNSSSLPDGNSDFDLEYSAGKQAQVQANMSSFQPRLYAALVSFDIEEDTAANIPIIKEYTIPAIAPFTVTVDRTPVDNTIVVVNQDDSPFTSGAGAGQYTNTGAEFTFNSADAEKTIVISYDFAAASAGKMTLARQTNNDVFRVTVAGEAVDKGNEGITKYDAVTFDRMMAAGEISMPPRQKEPAGWSFPLKVLPPRPGYKVVEYVVEN